MKVITGFQTGVDTGAILAAYKTALETGGHTVQGFKNEVGYWPTQRKYGAIDDCVTYAGRTIKNVQECSACLYIALDFKSAGTLLTIKQCVKYKKPIKRVFYDPILSVSNLDSIAENVLMGLLKLQPEILLVAGNRESVAPGIQLWTEILLYHVFVQYKEKV